MIEGWRLKIFIKESTRKNPLHIMVRHSLRSDVN